MRQPEQMTQVHLGIPQLSEARLIGSGGYSSVYSAWHGGLGRTVAVKVVPRIDDPRQQFEFERECTAMGRLSDHPNVVVPLSAGVTTTGDLYLILEYYADGSCAELIRRRGPLEPRQLSDWVRQVGGALGLAHERQILHNDLKPENVLVRRADSGLHYAVSDFGLARILDGHTEGGVAAGSLLFVAPELLDGQPPTPASDVYGLAATVCFMASGEGPFTRRTNESWISVVRRIALDPVDLDIAGAVPPPLGSIVASALDKEPAGRPTLEQLLNAAASIDRFVERNRLQAERSTEPARTDPPVTNWASTVKGHSSMDISAVSATVEGRSAPNQEVAEKRQLGTPWFILGLVVLFAVSALIGLLLR